MSTGYAVSSLVWITVGFIVGYLVGSHLNGEDTVADARPRRDWRRWLRRNLLGVLTLLVVAASTALYAHQAAELSQVTQCQARYNQAVSEALERRSESAAAERSRSQELAKAQQGMWLALLRNAPAQPGQQQDPRRRQASIAALNVYLRTLEDYQRASREAGAAREDNPLPALDCRHGDAQP